MGQFHSIDPTSDAPRTVYLTVPVYMDINETPEITMGDDGEPGVWGNCYLYDERHPDGGDWYKEVDEHYTEASDFLGIRLRKADLYDKIVEILNQGQQWSSDELQYIGELLELEGGVVWKLEGEDYPDHELEGMPR